MRVLANLYDDYFDIVDVSTTEKLKMAWKEIVWHGFPMLSERHKPSFSRESVEALPEEIQWEANKTWREYDSYTERLKKRDEFLVEVLKVLKIKNEKKFVDAANDLVEKRHMDECAIYPSHQQRGCTNIVMDVREARDES